MTTESQQSPQPIARIRTNRPRALFRIAQVGLLVSMFWKYEFIRVAIRIYYDIPIVDEFFPWILRDPTALLTLYIGVAAGAVVGMFCSGIARSASSLITVVGCTGLCLHQATYNDATFTTMWWVSLWSLWLSRQIDRADDKSILRQAAFLSRLIVSMILLGGAAGKWTSEYWSGEVMYQIYFVDRDFWVFNHLRNFWEPETLRSIATYYSRMIIVTETVFGLGLWCMPPKIAATLGILLLTSIVVFSNFLLMSVMGCLIAMLTAGMFVFADPAREDEIGG